MGIQCGIVGLPNVGKSTLFNALTKAGIAAANFPFCTIEPNVGVVPVPDPRLDALAVEEYFALGYVADPRCIFRAARKLPPAHTLTLVRGMKLAEPRSYWDVRFVPNHQITAEAASSELAERLSEAVAIRLESEVPLGAFLSGGVDSSAVVAAMSAVSGTPPITCSIGFAESAFDETRYADLFHAAFFRAGGLPRCLAD